MHQRQDGRMLSESGVQKIIDDEWFLTGVERASLADVFGPATMSDGDNMTATHRPNLMSRKKSQRALVVQLVSSHSGR